MTAPACHTCGHVFTVGESAWADDWTVIDPHDRRWNPRMETRWTCDDCEANE